MNTLLDPLYIAYELALGRILLTAETGAIFPKSSNPSPSTPENVVVAAAIRGKVVDENNAGLLV